MNPTGATPQRTKDEKKAVDLAERVRHFGARSSGEGEVMQLCSAVISLADKVRDLRALPSETATPTMADVIAWADGVQGALGTEYANRVTESEAKIAAAILAVAAPQSARPEQEAAIRQLIINLLDPARVKNGMDREEAAATIGKLVLEREAARSSTAPTSALGRAVFDYAPTNPEMRDAFCAGVRWAESLPSATAAQEYQRIGELTIEEHYTGLRLDDGRPLGEYVIYIRALDSRGAG